MYQYEISEPIRADLSFLRRHGGGPLVVKNIIRETAGP